MYLWSRMRSFLPWLGVAVVVLTGCPGELTNADEFPDTPLPPCPSNIDVERDIFAQRCGSSACHEGDDPQAGLDLISPGVFERLLEAPVEHEQCADMGMVLVGTDPDTILDDSFLMAKLLNRQGACGDPMPQVGLLTSAQLGCVQRWIGENLTGGDVDAGPPRDAGMMSMDDGGPVVDEDAGPVAEEDAGRMDEDAGPEPAGCSGISDGGFTVCVDTAGACEALYEGGGSSCDDVCALAGLTCMTAYADADDGSCTFDDTVEVACNNDDDGMSDYCVCGS